MRHIAVVIVMTLGLDVAAYATNMQPSAPQKMTSPDQARKMRNCEEKAAQNNIKMSERSKYVMDCMKEK